MMLEAQYLRPGDIIQTWNGDVPNCRIIHAIISGRAISVWFSNNNAAHYPLDRTMEVLDVDESELTMRMLAS